MQIIVNCKCQIGFTASKIQNRYFPVLRELRKNILDKLQETVDLAELIKLCPHDFPFFCHNSQIL